jgi:hypothetical protein
MVNRTYTVTGVLAADVANSATFDLPYPTGTTQTDFTAGLAGTGSYLFVNSNDKWTAAAGKISLAFGASTITVTNSTATTLAAGSTVSLTVDVQDGNDVLLVQIPISLVAITAAGDVATNMRLGVAGTIEYWEFVVTEPVTTAAKLATLNLEINSTNLTGGTIALTSAAATPLGKVIAGAAITGANVLTPDDTLSIEAASVTAFSEGRGFVNIRIRKTASYA